MMDTLPVIFPLTLPHRPSCQRALTYQKADGWDGPLTAETG
jgi:hypothetical protein